MGVELVKRHVIDLARETLDTVPITVISGARQVGKSTLAGQLAAERDARVVTLDSAVDRAAASADPDGFVDQYPRGLLAIDEVQRVPELLIALKRSADQHRAPGRFLITGSSDLLAVQGGQESLAGRAQTIALEGFSRGEIEGHVEDFASFAWGLSRGDPPGNVDDLSRRDYLEMSVASTFPELRHASASVARRWLSNYTDRVLSKDAAEVSGNTRAAFGRCSHCSLRKTRRSLWPRTPHVNSMCRPDLSRLTCARYATYSSFENFRPGDTTLQSGRCRGRRSC